MLAGRGGALGCAQLKVARSILHNYCKGYASRTSSWRGQCSLASQAFFTGGSGRGEVRKNTPGNYSQVFVERLEFQEFIKPLMSHDNTRHMTSASVVS